jgi:hypothetical protein
MRQYKTAVGEGFVWQISGNSPRVGRFDVGLGRFDLLDVGVVGGDITVSGTGVWIAACGTPGTVVLVDGRAGQVIATVAAGGSECRAFVAAHPVSIAAGQEGVWVTDAINGTVSRIREVDNQTELPIRLGDSPTSVAVGLGSVWVTVDGKESPSPSTS